MLVLWLVFQKVALMCAAGKSMLRTRQAQRLANGGVVHRYQPVEFIDRPAFRRDVDEDGVFGGGFSGSESDEFDVDMDAGPEDAEDAPPPLEFHFGRQMKKVSLYCRIPMSICLCFAKCLLRTLVPCSASMRCLGFRFRV